MSFEHREWLDARNAQVSFTKSHVLYWLSAM